MPAYRLSVCVDFYDDLLTGPFDQPRLHALLRAFREVGMTRVYWIYTHRQEGAGYLQCTPFARIAENARATYNRIGDFLPAAVRAAHDLGMEIYAVYKPFDLAHNDTFPFGSPAVARYGMGMQSLSGEMFCGLRSMVPLAHLRMKRRTDDLPADLDRRVVRRIRFTGLDAAPTRLRPEHLRLAVSRDNGAYAPYAGPLQVMDSVENGRRVLTLDGLRIPEPFFVLETPFRDNAATLRNTLVDLAQVYDEEGRPVPFTYGLISRADRYSHDVAADGRLDLWSELSRDGYCFNLPDFHAPERPHIALDNRRGYLAFARGKEMYIAGALAPAYDAVHDFWLSHVRECLDAGVDGVDLRDAQHNRSLVWEDYGFESPVIEEYLRRHGESDPARFDREKQVEILSDRYTDFYAKAARLIRSRGKRVQLHVNLLSRRYMGLKWDWERWIREGLADEITLKSLWPADEPRLDRICPHTAPRGIPLHSCPWLVDQKGGPELRQRLGDGLHAAASGGRESGFILYESGYVVEIGPDLRPRFVVPEVFDALRAMG